MAELAKAQRTRVVTGVEVDGVFVDGETIENLADQDRWDSDFGKVLLLDRDVARVLVAGGYAEQETRGGYHRGPKIDELRAVYES